MEKNIDKNQAPPYLKVEDIYKSFGANKVLKGISFDLSKGQVLAIIGSSGSGKTTLLRCITFLERADRGVLTVGDNVLFDMSKVKTEDGTLSSSLSSPLCTKVRYLKAKALYVKSVTGPLARFEYGEKREYSLPVSENTEDFAEFLRIPFISRPLRKAAEEIYISRRRSELIAESLERDKQRAMRADAAHSRAVLRAASTSSLARVSAMISALARFFAAPARSPSRSHFSALAKRESIFSSSLIIRRGARVTLSKTEYCGKRLKL